MLEAKKGIAGLEAVWREKKTYPLFEVLNVVIILNLNSL
jgi:hypothetical protein